MTNPAPAATITAAKRLIAAESPEGLRLLGAGVSRPCSQDRYNRAAEAALSDATAHFTADERRLIASFMAETRGQGRPPTLGAEPLRLSLYLPGALRARIDAARGDRPVAEIIREAVEGWLAAHETRGAGEGSAS